MTLKDQFFLSREDMVKSLQQLENLHQAWLQKKEEGEEKAKIENSLTELKNAVRGVEWEIEDLEDTLVIIEKNSTKFNIEDVEVIARRQFIDESREKVRIIKQGLHETKNKEPGFIEALRPSLGEPKYTRVETEADVPFYNQHQQQMSRNGYDSVYQPTTQPGLEALLDLNKKLKRSVGETSVMLDQKEIEIDSMSPSLRGSVSKMVEAIQFPAMQRKRWLAIGAGAGVTLLFVMGILLI